MRLCLAGGGGGGREGGRASKASSPAFKERSIFNSKTSLMKTQHQAKAMIDFLLLLTKNFTCRVYLAVYQLW